MTNGKVCIGFSKPMVALYNAAAGAVTYSGCTPLARGVSVNIEPTVSDDNIFYADNVAAENEGGTFIGGTATLETDHPNPEAGKMIFGLPDEEEITVGEKKVKIRSYGDKAKPPYVGIGFIVMYMQDGVTTYAPVVLRKAKFKTPSENAKTKENTIEWQKSTHIATLMRDDSDNHDWKQVAEDQTTEALAEEVLRAMLGGGAA